MALSVSSICEAKVFAWVGFYPGALSSLVEIDLASGKIGPELAKMPYYSGDASCTQSSTDGTFTCLGATYEYGRGNLTVVSKDGKFASYVTPNEVIGGWLSGFGVTALDNQKYLITRDTGLVRLYSIGPDYTFQLLGKPLSFYQNRVLVNTAIATPTRIWMGLGNYSISHWDRVDYQFVGVDISGKGLAPIITPITKDITWSSCYYSKKEGSPICLAKQNQVNGPTRLIKIDDATGDIKVMCDKIDGIEFNVYPFTTTYDPEGEIFYFMGREQTGKLNRSRDTTKLGSAMHQHQHQGFQSRDILGDSKSHFYTLKVGSCAAQRMELSGADGPLGVWQLMVV